MRVVGNFIGQVAKLCLHARLAAIQESAAHAAKPIRIHRLGCFDHHGVAGRAMFENALASLEGQIETVEIRVTLFQHIDNTQTLQVVLEPAIGGHATVQGILASVAKRGVTQIVGKCDRLHQIFVEPERTRNRTSELRYLQ